MDQYVNTAQQRVQRAQALCSDAYQRLERTRQTFPRNEPRIATQEGWVLACEQWLAHCEQWLAWWEVRRDQDASGPDSV